MVEISVGNAINIYIRLEKLAKEAQRKRAPGRVVTDIARGIAHSFHLPLPIDAPVKTLDEHQTERKMFYDAVLDGRSQLVTTYQGRSRSQKLMQRDADKLSRLVRYALDAYEPASTVGNAATIAGIRTDTIAKLQVISTLGDEFDHDGARWEADKKDVSNVQAS